MNKRIWMGALALWCGWVAAQPAGLVHHGNFTEMMRSGQAKAQVALSQLDRAPGTWGVGAMTDLKGEVIQVDGRVLVSLGSDPEGRVAAPEPNASATLWASAKVAQWTQVTVPSHMDQAQFEAFVQTQAQAQRLDLQQPFVFRVTGDYTHLIWHVVTGEAPKGGAGGHSATAHGGHQGHGAGRANHQSGMKLFRQPRVSGQLVGVYSGAQLEGVISHGGERFHLHYIDDAQTVSGHVDQYNVRAGATLWLPQRLAQVASVTATRSPAPGW